MQTILHITNDYSGSKVYRNLIGELDKLGISQIVYTPIRDELLANRNKIDFKLGESRIVYSKILNTTTDRIFYKKKIRKIFKDIESKIDFSKIKLIHAHTWYSDGGVAYLIHKKYNIPYVIAVRSTDINMFYKYLIHQRSFGNSILRAAENIFLINKVFYDFFRYKYEELSSKTHLIPNGIDSFWLENYKLIEKEKSLKKNVLYVGTFIPRKNLYNLIIAFLQLKKESNLLGILSIVGYGEGKYALMVRKLIEENTDSIIFHKKTNDKKELLGVYQQNQIFAMPSKNETFGLVYIEAMLQGLPVLYTENEGIDGLYDEKIGEKVSSSEVEEIKKKLLLLLKNYDKYEIPTEKLIENHNWKNIALQYKSKYESI